MIHNIKNIKIDTGNLLYGFLDGAVDFKLDNKNARKDLLSELACLTGRDDCLIYEVKQIHGNKIAILDEAVNFNGSFDPIVEENICDNTNNINLREYDGMFTQKAGLALCIRTADCIPVLFYDGAGKIIGALHCGWRGLFLGIINNAGNILTNYFNSDLSDAVAVIGPSICKSCFEVKDDFINKVINKDKNNRRFLNKKDGKSFFDLKEYLKNQLNKAGFKLKNIYDINMCNFEDADFYSYRRDKTDKRQVSFILLY